MDVTTTHPEVSGVEEEIGFVKTGWLITCNSSKLRKYYALLGDRALELHESEKTQKKKRHPRHIIDMSTCFNVHRHYEGKLKYCIAVMTPDETFFLKDETDIATDEWFDCLISVLIPSRALHLGRPVLASEFFEYAWDVTIVSHPKLKKPMPNPDKIPNMCKKEPSWMGFQRLCFYPHTIILCKKGIEPAGLKDLHPSCIPPFRQNDFTELSRKYIATFGCQEKYFMMRMGRASPSGTAEIWALCENEEVASEIHDCLNKIIERESEKKKKIVNGSLLQSACYSLSRIRLEDRARKKLSVHVCGNNDSSISKLRAYLRETRAMVNSLEQLGLTEQSNSDAFSFTNSKMRKWSLSTNIPSSSSFSIKCKIDRSLSENERISTFSSTDKLHHLKNKTIKEEIPSSMFHEKEHNPIHSSTTSVADETEDSGGTLRVVDIDMNRQTMNQFRDSKNSTGIKVPQELHDRCSPWLAQLISPSFTNRIEMDEHQDEGSLSAACSTSTNDEFVSTTPGDISEGTSADNLEYMPMEIHSCSSGSTSHLAIQNPFEQQYNLDEIRSYVSDSSDSCYSSMAPKSSRTYSFGSHITSQQLCPRHHKQFDESYPIPDFENFYSKQEENLKQNADLTITNRFTQNEDLRKRAFSLGSKSWFQKPFRKLSRDFMFRAHHRSNASASILPNSSSIPTVPVAQKPKVSGINSIQAYIAVDPHPSQLDRSSNLSSLLTPYGQRSNFTDHISLDFGTSMIVGNHSASNSVYSIDGLNRSSIGCNQRCTFRDPGDVVVHNVDFNDNSSASITEGLKINVEANRERDEYVAYDPVPKATDFRSSNLAPTTSINEIHFGCSNFIDLRGSQPFETIVENNSGRSSRASSKNSIRNEAIEDKFSVEMQKIKLFQEANDPVKQLFDQFSVDKSESFQTRKSSKNYKPHEKSTELIQKDIKQLMRSGQFDSVFGSSCNGFGVISQ